MLFFPYEKNSVGTVNMGDVIMEEMIVDLMKVVCERFKLTTDPNNPITIRAFQ